MLFNFRSLLAWLLFALNASNITFANDEVVLSSLSSKMPFGSVSCFVAFLKIEQMAAPSPLFEGKLSANLYSTGTRQLQKVVVLGGSDLSQADREHAAEIISQTNQFLEDRFVLPPRLLIVHPKEGGVAHQIFGKKLCELSFPRNFICHGTTMSRTGSDPVAEHEYGHSLYKTNMKKLAEDGVISDTYIAFSDIYDHQRHGLKLTLYNTYIEAQLGSARLSDDGSVVVKDLESKLDAVKKKQFALGEKWDALEHRLRGLPINFHVEYEELFSDLLSIAKRNDPQAISIAAPGDSIFAPKARDASVPKLPRGWLSDVPDRAHQDDHVLLAPVLYHVWNRYIQNAKESTERSLILREVFLSIADETEERMKDRDLWMMTAERKNERLIKKIDLRLVRVLKKPIT